jgi:predicted AAA+ superfamily ATPase
MFPRLLKPPRGRSFFLFGPRGTGKSSWVRAHFGGVPYFDLLSSASYVELLAAPDRLEGQLPPSYRGWVVIDEVQKVPALLDVAHRLIESRGLKFVLTGSSARKLKRKGVNLLAGRALTKAMHSLTAVELGKAFQVERSLAHGQLPSVHDAFEASAAREYLKSYVSTYLREEVQQEGLTRNVAAFSRFLEAASFSQGCVLNISEVARECHVERKTVEEYFSILEDLLLAVRIPVFSRRAKRDLTAHRKFYLFDAGVFRTVRPRGPLDSEAELDGAALETLVLQELRAHNDYGGWGYQVHYWRTRTGLEVDFVLYGERGLLAVEVKRASRLRTSDFASLRAFIADYPMAKPYLVYLGGRAYWEGPIRVLPVGEILTRLPELLAG